jgi:hypothetical protein
MPKTGTKTRLEKDGFLQLLQAENIAKQFVAEDS